MNILAHRGYWGQMIPSNSSFALRKALENGYGFESDIRDFNGKLVISHDIANTFSQDAEEVFQWLTEFHDELCFAINIKADGLKGLLKRILGKYKITNYFLFDMSVPQMVEFREMRLKYFTRQSDVEPDPCLYGDAEGVWIDGFYSIDWITEKLLNEHIQNGKKICLVSPELHRKDNYKEFWKKINGYNLDWNYVMLCTDHPNEAKEFFYGQ